MTSTSHILNYVCIVMIFTHIQNIHVFGAIFQGVGDLPGGPFGSNVRAVSPNGDAVVGNSFSEVSPTNLGEAFRWTQFSGIQAEGVPDDFPSAGEGVTSFANAVTNAGITIVGGAGAVSERQELLGKIPFILDANDGFLHLDIDTVGYVPTAFSDISEDGKTAVGEGIRSVGSREDIVAFRWTEASGFSLLPTDSSQSFATAISANGLATVGTSFVETGNSNLSRRAVRWVSGEEIQLLGNLAGGDQSSTAKDISANGSIVVGSAVSSSGTEGFYWTEAHGMIGLGDLPGGATNGIAEAVSSDGKFLVGRGLSDNRNSPQAAIWDENRGWQSIEKLLLNQGLSNVLNGWQLEIAVDISADGLTIVGNGVNPQGRQEGWVAVLDDLPDPELRPGDIDLDGAVSLSDFTILKEHFGIGGFRYQGDLDGDFDVDLEDFIIVKSHFGEGAAQVPEPATWVLLVIAMIGWFGYRSRAQRCFDC